MPQPTAAAAVLVCAPREGSDPDVVLADGSYETPDGDRVFWRASPDDEVLRLPSSAPVSVRRLPQFPARQPHAAGEDRLLAALARHRQTPHQLRLVTPASASEETTDVMTQLTQALATGDVLFAEVLLRLLVHQEGLDTAHQVLADCLAEAGEAWVNGEGVVQERIKSRTLQALLERTLPYGRRSQTRGTVLLTVPEGERHTIALLSLAHQFAIRGWYALILDDVPATELARHVLTEAPVAVVVSAHMPLSNGAVRRIVTDIRKVRPSTVIAVGGPGVRPGLRGPDIVTDDVGTVLRLLEHRASVLTERETEILVLVAEGLTNADIALKIGVSTTTVKSHMDHVFTKSGTVHRAAAVAHALRTGWIS